MTPLSVALYLTAILVSLVFQLMMAGYAFQRRQTPGALWFALLALVVAAILLGVILSLFSETAAAAVFWFFTVRYSFATLLAPLTVAFLLRLWRVEPWGRLRYIGLMFVVPAISIALIVTNPLHGLSFETTSIVPAAGMMVGATSTPGPWLIVFNFYAALLGLVALGLLVWRSRAAGPAEHIQLALIGAALLLMMLAPVGVRLSPLGSSPLAWTPVASTFASGLLFVAVVVQNIFDVPGTARQVLIDRMDDLVVVLDTQGRLVDLNPAAQRNLGADRVQLVGRPIDDVLRQLQIDHSFHVDEGMERGEVRVLRSGERTFYDARMTRLLGAQETWLGYLIVLRDVTRQKTIETTLAERERRYRALFEQTNDYVIIAGLDGTVIDVNRQALATQWANRAAVVGSKLWDFPLPNERTDARRQFERAVAGEHLPVYERTVLDATGTPRHVEVNISLVTDDAGRPLHVQSIVRDITERRRILEAEREQRALAEALLEISLALNSTLETDPLFALILEQLQRVVPHDTSGIVLLTNGHAYVAQSQGITDPTFLAMMKRMDFNPHTTEYFDLMIQSKRPVVVDDVAKVDGWARLPRVGSGSFCGAPILVEDKVIGFLGAHKLQPHAFTFHDGQALAVFAEHVALAIRNARTYEQAQRLAAFEERERLARDLHDSVSQTLFSAKVTADMLPILAARDPVQALENIQHLRRLIRGGLSEMRILLRELRPAALEQASLGLLLGQLVDAARGRTSTPINTFVAPEAELPVNVKVGLYRIAQEAMNNAIKHAGASAITLRLAVAGEQAVLEVSDDGVGFDPTATKEQGMGLQILRERAEKIGATLSLRSTPQAGTVVTVCWQPHVEGRGEEQETDRLLTWEV